MKNISHYIVEKFRLNKDMLDMPNGFEIKSQVTHTPFDFDKESQQKRGCTLRRIVPGHSFKPARIYILIEYAKEILKNNLLTDAKDKAFVENWLARANEAYRKNRVDGLGYNSEGGEFDWLCNGDAPYFGNAKFTYDLLQYALSKDNPPITKPRKQKVEKMLRQWWADVADHKDEMNWYND